MTTLIAEQTRKLTRRQAQARLVDMVDLIVAHKLHMVRVDRYLQRHLRWAIDGLVDELMDVIVTLYPYPEQLSKEALEGRGSSVDYTVLKRVAPWTERYGQQFATRIYELLDRFLRAQCIHEYRFWRVITEDYVAAPRLVEAEEWQSAIGAIDEYAPFGATARMMKIEPPPLKHIESVLKAPAPWDGKTWDNRLPYLEGSWSKGMKRDVRAVLTKGLREGLPVNKVRTQLEDVLPAKLQHKASILARTETAHLGNTVREAEFEAGAELGLYAGKVAIGTLDAKTCIICASLSGKEYWYDDREPSAWNAPYYPQHPFCRCEYAPISKWADELGLDLGPRGSAMGPIEGDFDEWLHRMDKRQTGFSEEWLGGKNYEKWVGGKSLAQIAGSPKSAVQVALSKVKKISKVLKPALEEIPTAPTYRTWPSGKKATQWADDEFAAWQKGLTKAEEESLRSYKGYGYSRINEGLRRPGELAKQWGKTYFKKTVQPYVNKINAAIKKDGLRENITVFRGFNSPAVSKNWDRLVGKIIEDKGFVSTSVDKRVAEVFCKRSRGVLAEIRVPKGAKGAWLGIMEPAEAEFLLANGSKFRVIEAKTVRGVRHIVLELLL